jgi:DNA (cytosine-5)-methyltransferase 1
MGMNEPTTYKMIDLFAGIGGFRIGLSNAMDIDCVFSSEWDKYASKTYEANHGEAPFGDITTIDPVDIPDHDILTAGFPCQPFSISGVSKRNSLGYEHGFKHPTQGTLFFNVKNIINAKKPRVFILENVKNLLHHDRGNTWKVIQDTLTNELGYHITHKVINASSYVPQARERIFIVGFVNRRELDKFSWPDEPKTTPKFKSILDKKVDIKYTLGDKTWATLQRHAAHHASKGNGFGYGLTDLNGTARTLSARYYKDGGEVLVEQRGKNPRRLTPRECARLMGYPDDFKIVCSDTQTYKQFGNSVVPPVIEAIGKSIKVALDTPTTDTV